LPLQDGDDAAPSDGAPYEDASTFVWGTSVNVKDATQRFHTFLTNFELDPTAALPFYVHRLHEIKQREVGGARCLRGGTPVGTDKRPSLLLHPPRTFP
jgi:hypothetical protein